MSKSPQKTSVLCTRSIQGVSFFETLKIAYAFWLLVIRARHQHGMTRNGSMKRRSAPYQLVYGISNRRVVTLDLGKSSSRSKSKRGSKSMADPASTSMVTIPVGEPTLPLDASFSDGQPVYSSNISGGPVVGPLTCDPDIETGSHLRSSH